MEMKVYVWEDVLKDYTSGCMVALAPSVEAARALILEQDPHVIKEDLAKEPKVETEPFAVVVWGGG